MATRTDALETNNVSVIGVGASLAVELATSVDKIGTRGWDEGLGTRYEDDAGETVTLGDLVGLDSKPEGVGLRGGSAGVQR